jgi:hypothetical protein
MKIGYEQVGSSKLQATYDKVVQMNAQKEAYTQRMIQLTQFFGAVDLPGMRNEIDKRKRLEDGMSNARRQRGSESLKKAVDAAKGEKVETQEAEDDLKLRVRDETLLKNAEEKTGSKPLTDELEGLSADAANKIETRRYVDERDTRLQAEEMLAERFRSIINGDARGDYENNYSAYTNDDFSAYTFTELNVIQKAMFNTLRDCRKISKNIDYDEINRRLKDLDGRNKAAGQHDRAPRNARQVDERRKFAEKLGLAYNNDDPNIPELEKYRTAK